MMESGRLVQVHHLTLLVLRLEVLQVDEGVALHMMMMMMRQVFLLVGVRGASVPAQDTVHAVHGGVHGRRDLRCGLRAVLGLRCWWLLLHEWESESAEPTADRRRANRAAAAAAAAGELSRLCCVCALRAAYCVCQCRQTDTHRSQPAPTKLARLLAHTYWVLLRLCTAGHQGCSLVTQRPPCRPTYWPPVHARIFLPIFVKRFGENFLFEWNVKLDWIKLVLIGNFAKKIIYFCPMEFVE